MRQLTDHKARQDRQTKGAMQVQGINLTLHEQIILLSHLLPSVGSFTTIKTLLHTLAQFPAADISDTVHFCGSATYSFLHKTGHLVQDICSFR